MCFLKTIRILGIVGLLITTVVIQGCDKSSSPAPAASGASSSGSGGSNASSSADDQAASEFVRSKIAETWLKDDDGWATQLHRRNAFGEPMDGVPEILYLQYRDLKFSVRPVALTESQKLNGSTFRAEITFEYVPTRRYRTVENFEGPPGWSRWQDEQPAEAIVVELRNGKWLMSDAELFAGRKPDPAAVPR